MIIDKEKTLSKWKMKRYRIYGIFDFVLERLIYVSLDKESAMIEYDIEDYNEERFDVVSFDVMLT